MGGDDVVITNRIYIGCLPRWARESDLQRFLHGYGEIKKILLMKGYAFVEFKEDRDAEHAIYELNGKRLGEESVVVAYATVSRSTGGQMSTTHSSSRHDGGYDRQNQYDFEGQGVRERNGRDGYDKYDDRNRRPDGSQGYYGPLYKSPYRVIVKNLSAEASWQDLKDFMRKAGEVTFTSAHQRRPNEGIAEFGNQESLDRALQDLNGSQINGVKVRLYRDCDAAEDDDNRSMSRRSDRSISRRSNCSVSRSSSSHSIR